MNKKGELSYLALLGIVGVVALVGLVLISTNGSSGTTGKAVYVTGVDTATGQAKLVDVSQQGGLPGISADLGSIKEQLPLPDKISVFFGGLGDATIYNKDGYVTNSIFFADPAQTQPLVRMTRIPGGFHLSGIPNPHFTVGFSQSTDATKVYAFDIDVVGTNGQFFIQEKDLTTGVTTATRVRFQGSTEGSVNGFWFDGFIIGNFGTDGVTFNNGLS